MKNLRDILAGTTPSECSDADLEAIITEAAEAPAAENPASADKVTLAMANISDMHGVVAL